MSPDPAAPRINRRFHFVQVESATVRDTRLSYRALGLLTYLLDQSEEWQVRTDQLARGEGREGREAIRKVLHELAAHGYYRLERRRLLNRKYVMGTAISEFPVQQWAEDYQTFGKKLQIPVVEQEGGSFLVQYPDGTLGSDGFESAPAAAGEPQSKPGHEAPVPAVADEQKPKPPVRKRAAPAKKTVAATAKAAAEKTARETELDDAAEKVAAWWWGDAEKRLGPYVGAKGGYVAMRKQVRMALEKGYTQRQCADALRHAARHWPSAQQWQTALTHVTRGIAPVPGNRAVPYSDEATWGDTTTPHHDDHDDGATFGVLTD